MNIMITCRKSLTSATGAAEKSNNVAKNYWLIVRPLAAVMLEIE